MTGPVVLVDIEGTIADIAFVKNVLFPYAREALPEFVARHGQRTDVREQLNAAAAEAGVNAGDDAAIVAALQQWIDEDRKVTPLKALQGKIWRDGYESGAFTAHLYADAYEKLKLWRGNGIPLYVYSSGSVEAQDLYFGHTEYGDLRGWFDGFFDTNVGHKRERSSYVKIAEAIGCAPADIVFFSDVTAELDAAREAGMRTVHIQRGKSEPSDHPVHDHFNSIPLNSIPLNSIPL